MAVEKDVLMEMLRRMMRIRHFEGQVEEFVSRGEMVGSAHTYVGEEAVAVGACVALNPDDYMTGNHRSHGHPIAKGGDVRKAMAELLGRSTGICKGKGGSMHLADFSVGSLGESGTLGSATPTAVGAALGCLLQGNGRVAVTFFGDGASNEGAVWESMNLAGVWKLPVIFLCENNQYAVTSSFKEMCASENIADRAQAYNFPGILVDGQDVMAVHEAVSHAAARARSGEGPSLIEARTYRFQEHSLGMERIIKVQYRTEEELEEWMRRDPIQMHAANLVAQDIATQAEIDQVDQEEKARIVEAAEFARQSPFPEPSAIFDDMFAVPIPLE